MNWSDVGNWLKNNAGTGASLVGSLLTGNVPGAVAAGVALVSSATGTSDPGKALDALQTNPAIMLRLRELTVQEDQSIRQHIQRMEEMRLTDAQAEHAQQQETIRAGDKADDLYTRHTRPLMARQSWYLTGAYVVGFELLKAFRLIDIGAQLELAITISTPAWAYLGLRTADKMRGLFGKK